MRAITLPLIDIDLHDTHRIIPSVWDEPVLSDATGGDTDLLDKANRLDSATNPRMRPARHLAPNFLLPDNDLLHAHIVNGAFVHGSADSRFSSPAIGAWYSSDSLTTARLEVAWHKAREFEYKDPQRIAAYFPQVIGYTDCLASPRTTVHVIERRESPYLDPVDYRTAQGLADELRAAGSLGIRYPSVRDRRGQNLALFQPTVVHPVVMGSRSLATWASPGGRPGWEPVHK